MTAEELLMMSDEIETYAADDALVIDAENRIILTPADGLLLGVESDEEAERIKFVCPRIVGDNIDLSTLQLRVIYRNANGDKDFRICTDITIDGENIRFSWSLSRKVTRYKGMVNFIICAIRTQSDGSIKNEWNTTLAEGTVLEGLEVDILEEEFEEPKDIVLQLLGMLDEKATEIMKEIDKYLEKLKIDNNLDVNSENAIQNKVVAKQFNQLSEEIVETKNDLMGEIENPFALEMLKNITFDIVHDNDGYGINNNGGLSALPNGMTSNQYPCRAGDKIRLYAYINNDRKYFCTFDAEGNLNEDSLQISSSVGFRSFEYTFTENDYCFRVASSTHTTNTDKYEWLLYIPQEHIGLSTKDKLALNILTPEMFGAIGDGVTDDSMQIQQMFDFAYYYGASIYMPNGKTYVINTPIILREYNMTPYSVNGDNYSVNSNFTCNTENGTIFIGENFPLSTEVNIQMSGISSKVDSEKNITLFKRLIFKNESIIEKCKFINFNVIFEASTLRVCSEIKTCTFWGIGRAFMTNKHQDIEGHFTQGSDVGFLADSKIVNCYISGSVKTFPSVFIGTHADSDTVMQGCFIEFCKYVFEDGYDDGFYGIIFSECDFQYCYRFSSKGSKNVHFANCYITAFSKNTIPNKITMEGIEDFLNTHEVGFICSDLDENGYNVELINFTNVTFDNCIVNECDNFITLRGGSGIDGYNFENTYIRETGTTYTKKSELMTNGVILKGKMNVKCWSDTLQNIQTTEPPKATNGGMINNAFVGQIVMHENGVYFAHIKDGKLTYSQII